MSNVHVLKQALEALESYYGYMEPLTTVFGGPRVPAEQSTTGKVEQAIASLRQAIAAAEKQEPNLTEQGRNKSAVFGNNIKEMMDAGLPFFAALQTTLQVYDHPTNVASSDTSQERVDEIAKQRHEQEPVAWADLQKEAQQIVESKFVWKRFIDGTPLSNDIACWMADFAQQHTSPPQRQTLTDEQIDFLNFLYGAGEWDGVWFEGKHPTKRGAFWWRKDMKRLFDYGIKEEA